MKSKKSKLSFTKTTLVNLADIRGGQLAEDDRSVSNTFICDASQATVCDAHTNCYAYTRCYTQCGPGGMAC